mmetsp:Transcript_27552/g.76980  ORF Transcript_27552/g.76980 Transcript_27552/m.76980 type:complete len:270 (-) Transcript_27552:518-1327(-)
MAQLVGVQVVDAPQHFATDVRDLALCERNPLLRGRLLQGSPLDKLHDHPHLRAHFQHTVQLYDIGMVAEFEDARLVDVQLLVLLRCVVLEFDGHPAAVVHIPLVPRLGLHHLPEPPVPKVRVPLVEFTRPQKRDLLEQLLRRLEHPHDLRTPIKLAPILLPDPLLVCRSEPPLRSSLVREGHDVEENVKVLLDLLLVDLHSLHAGYDVLREICNTVCVHHRGPLLPLGHLDLRRARAIVILIHGSQNAPLADRLHPRFRPFLLFLLKVL